MGTIIKNFFIGGTILYAINEVDDFKELKTENKNSKLLIYVLGILVRLFDFLIIKSFLIFFLIISLLISLFKWNGFKETNVEFLCQFQEMVGFEFNYFFFLLLTLFSYFIIYFILNMIVVIVTEILAIIYYFCRYVKGD